MSDAVIVGLIAGIANILCVIVGRLISSGEHRATAKDVKEIKAAVILNGKGTHL